MSPETQSFLQQVEHLSATTFPTEAERVQARNAVSALLARLRTPWESMWFYGWETPALLPCLKICTDVKLFEKWVAHDGGKKVATPASELATLVGVDHALLKRLLRFLSVMHVIDAKDRDVYALTPWAVALATPVQQHTVNFTFDINIEGFHNLPGFLKSVGYQNPADPVATNFAERFGKSLWELYEDKPPMGVDFQNAMTGYARSKTPWTEVYPISNLFTDLKPERVVLVDVGGGHGNDVGLLAGSEQGRQYLAKGSLVLEDLPATLPRAKVPDVVRTLEYDAFSEQPIKGARAYYMHIVLHDFPDTDAVKILKRQAEAMERGYSKLLLYEAIIGAENPEEAHVTMASDLTMMMVYNSSERSYETWTSLLGAAGLKINKIHNSPLASESIIEAELN